MAKNINPADYCTGSLRPRIPEDAAYMEAPGQVPVTQEIVNQLNAYGDPKVRLMEDVGIRINPDGNAEKTNDIPRMFILQQSADDPAADEVKELGSAGISFGSLAFWKEVQKGNVICYPAGMANPVQLRLDTSVPGKSDSRFSITRFMAFLQTAPSWQTDPLLTFQGQKGIGFYRFVTRC